MLNVVGMAVGQMVTLVLSNISVLPIKMHIIFNLVYGSQSSELLCYPGIEIACCLRMVLGLVLWKREVIIVVDLSLLSHA